MGCDLYTATQDDQRKGISIHAPGWGATCKFGARCSEITISIHAPGWGATSPSIGASCFIFDFNPRTRVGCDLADISATAISSRFQSTHPGGVRPAKIAHHKTYLTFQSTHPGGVRPAPAPRSCPQRLTYFNPRTRVGCDRLLDRRLVKLALFQSTHPGGVRLIDPQQLTEPLEISIHAPGWGATSGAAPRRGKMTNFNPRTRVGCDCSYPMTDRQSQNFNPRTRVGCDCGAGDYRAVARNFNPRTRVGCDSRGQRRRIPCAGDFNPRTRVGCDCGAGDYRAVARNFNPRTRVGCDSRGQRRRIPCAGDFNPRTRVGCDHHTSGCCRTDEISIHAPGWGATLALRLKNRRAEFQSTHPGGVRRGNICYCPSGYLFQSTHPGGVRPYSFWGI